MAHYVLSDLHGDSRRFHEMVKLISLAPTDTLYILGDVVDRGPEPIELLLEILAAPNMVLLLGNHEYMCLQYHAPDATETDIRRWNRNNNIPTLQGLARLTPERKQLLLDTLGQLPVHLEVTVEGQRYYLVHGFPGGSVRDEVWNRPEPDTPNPLPDCIAIVGHTPVTCLGNTEAEEEACNAALAARGAHMEVFYGPGYIDLDCGCGYDLPAAALSCLRLEDGKVFYIH